MEVNWSSHSKRLNQNINHKIKTCIFLFISIFFTSCGVEPKNYSDRVYLDRIEIGQGGIIGDYNFYETYPKFLNKYANAVGVISIHRDNGELITGGIGLHFKDPVTNKEFILTAGHIIYDPKTFKKEGNKIRFADYSENMDLISQGIESRHVIQQDIESLHNRKYNIFQEDWVLIPVNSTENMEPVEIDLRRINFNANTDAERTYPGYFVAISSPRGNKKSDFVKFVQKSDKLFLRKNPRNNFARTNLDAALGLSGSPVFYVLGEDVQLIGVMSVASKVENCPDINTDLNCSNGVSLLLPNGKMDYRMK